MSDSQNPWLQGRALGLGLGLLALVPGMAAADRGYSAGHAEISLGFPNGAITVGRTWESSPREVVVERVTHKLPETDYADEAIEEGYSEADVYEDEAPEEVIIEKRRPRVAKKVTIIEQYEEPRVVEREVVVRKVYVEPPCPPTRVVVHHAPTRVVYAPSRTVVVHSSPRHVHKVHVHGGGHHYRHGGGYHGGKGHSHGGRSIKVHDHGSRDLFPGDGGRPMRSRGTRNLVQVGGHRH